VSYNLEKYYRHRREIARLYQPLDQLPEDLPSDEDEEPMLPMYHAPQKQTKASQPRQVTRLGNVWDSREEVFEIGDDDDDDDDDDDEGRNVAGGGKVAPSTGGPKRSVRFS